ncbi:MAG: thiamine biosynthesis lipoprotein [Arcticibacterium sp.]|jgi:thiamine biosynthesis lipoprotein
MINYRNIKRVEKLMGNRFEICLVHDNEQTANSLLEEAVSEIKRIEKLLTTFSPDSQTNLINQNAGIRPQKVDAEVFALISRSIKISELTQGAFDISYGGIDKSLWNFDTTMKVLPSAEMALGMVRKINYKNIELEAENQSVFLKEKGMRIGFGGIGKGYAADRAKKLLQEKGVKGGYVNASGDLVTWGRQFDESSWTIGLSNPDFQNDNLGTLKIDDMAISTSGDYEKFAVINGKRYSHTIDPKTGLPVTGIKSVSVISTNAELADAMATPIMVMGVSTGLNMVNQLNFLECIIIDNQNRVFTSENLKVA